MGQVYFDNIEKVISSILLSAESRVYVAVAWFTNNTLFNELQNALHRNVKVKVLILDDILNRNEFGLNFGLLVSNGADVRYSKSNRGTMHNKFCVIDNKVITGSYNWTYQANLNNENIVVINESEITNCYCKHFEYLFNSCTPIKLPYEHLKWTDVKEGDFSELRRNIFRDVFAKNDENRELKQIKLINLNYAYKSGDADELANASLLPIEQQLRTITDVLTSRSHDYSFSLWEENIVGKPYDSYGHVDFIRWYFIPYQVLEDRYHREYVKGSLKTSALRSDILSKGLNLIIYDEEYVSVIKKYVGIGPITYNTRIKIPESIIRIEHAKMFYYQFPFPLFNKKQPRTWKNTMPRKICGINVMGIAKEVNGDDVVFYEGWDPKNRGKQIAKVFFVQNL